MATYAKDIEVVPGVIPEVTPTLVPAPLHPAALHVRDVEIEVFGLVGLVPTYAQAPMLAAALHVRDVEVVPFGVVGLVPTLAPAPFQFNVYVTDVDVVPFGLRDVAPNLVQAPFQFLTFPINVEVLQSGQIVATWEDDLVEQFVIDAIPTSRTTMYTVPVGRRAIIRWMDLVNTTGSAITVDVWLNNVQWENDRSVPGSDKYARDTITTLAAGQLIEMQASGAGANAFVSGVLELAS